MPYKFYNANSKGNYVNDCTVRAISLAEDISWNQAFKKLSRIAETEGILFDDVEFIEKYLDDRYPRQCHYSKKVGEFAREFPKGTYLVTMKRTYYLC